MFLLTSLLVSLPLLASTMEIPPGISTEEFGEIIRTLEEKCTKDTGAKPEDLIHLHDVTHLSDTRESKCMVACAADAYGIFDENGGPIVDKLYLYFRAQFKPQDHEKCMKIYMDCFTAVIKENIQDKCEYNFKIVQCAIDGINNEKIEKLKFWDI